MKAQIQCERSTRDQHPIQVVDRSALDPVIYAILTGIDADDSQRRRESLEASPLFQEVLVQYRKPSSVLILLTPVEEWLVDDGVRHLDDQKKTVDIFRDVLSRLNIPYIEIGPEEKSLERRVATVLKAAKLRG
ncbi:hypothetical protein BDZ89DRAFT_1070299 [Hymenopellis radicata]|nr:hypothetical protein BDZ89DRAFT_1070299 [Hymenopellis radicata]